MGRSWATTILAAQITFHRQSLAEPLHLATGTIENVLEAQVEVEIGVAGHRARGAGGIYLNDLWAWPTGLLSHASRESELRRLAERIADDLPEPTGGEPQHPTELGWRLSDSVRRLPWPVAGTATRVGGLESTVPLTPPPLARILCASPFDAAIHDAVGRAAGCSAFRLYSENPPLPSVDRHFADRSAAHSIRRSLRRIPRRRFDSWYVLGPHDRRDAQRAALIRARGDRHFKLKLLSGDPDEAVDWTEQAFDWLIRHVTQSPRICVDANEAFAGADDVATYLDVLRVRAPQAFAALQYLEQPTCRALREAPQDWRAVTLRKPVLIDEALVDFESLVAAREQGWSGVGLKTCKGHSLCLVAAAWAREHGLSVALQDLTNPGLALLHAALLAAWVPTVNGVELNSPQFTPAANEGWAERLPGLFLPTGGCHRLPAELPIGLGSVWRTAPGELC